MSNAKSFLKKNKEKLIRAYISVRHADLCKKGDELRKMPLFKECEEAWEEELYDWLYPYEYWIESDEWEKRLSKISFKASPGDEFETENKVGKKVSYVLMLAEGYECAEGFGEAVKECLKDLDKEPVFIYGDEDVYDGFERKEPYFKPCFSPELLEQFNYIGGAVLVRKDLVGDVLGTVGERSSKAGNETENESKNEVEKEKEENEKKDLIKSKVTKDNFYKLIKALAEKADKASFNEEELKAGLYKNILHIPHIISRSEKSFKYSDWEEKIIEKDFPEDKSFDQDFSEEKNEEKTAEESAKEVEKEAAEEAEKEATPKKREPSIDIIIPTKDHPDVLETCIASIKGRSNYKNFHITVIDNGSKPEAKEAYNKLSREYGFDYIYDPQPFNYSRMNNIAIRKTDSELVLLLNDDTEVITGSFLEKMSDYALRPEIGAVGAKLLFAKTNKIQHAGVTNLAVGPSHKLLEADDEKDHYFGRNKFDHDVFSVTGACMMIERKKLEKAGLLDEDLSVAYNDIDLCIRLFEAGYRSVQCNKAVLYHYESLTRGADEGDKGKYKRLLEEKEKLYLLHPWARGFDPFYNPNLIDNSADYLPAAKDCTRDTSAFCGLLEKPDSLPGDSMMIKARLDRVQKQLRNTASGKDFIWMDGWGFVRGCDNRRFDKSLCFTRSDKKEILRYELFATYRKDIIKAFPGEDHIDLSGFYLRIPAEDLGEYDWNVSIAMTDIMTGKMLCKDLKTVVKGNTGSKA